MQKKNIKISLAIVITVVLVFGVHPTLGTERLVPSQYATIQAAINASAHYDTIIVSPGTYNGNVSFNGKNITLRSTDPDNPAVVAATIIRGTGTTSVVKFTDKENVSCQLAGFTITGGAGASGGGGIAGNNNNTSPTIRQCIITGNSSTSAGGGIWGCGGKISACVIANNTTVYGGGIAACHGTIVNCLIYNNHASYGGGIHNCDRNIINCTITQNTGTSQGAVNSCDGFICNCIIWGNTPDTITNNTSVIYYSCWPEGTSGTGNINTNPSFVSVTDFHLAQGSACIDTGIKTMYARDDIEGNPRPQDGDRNGSEITDMGVYEYPGPAKFMMKKPVGGEVWVAGSTHKIEWLGLNYNGTINLAYSINGGVDWLPVVSGVNNSGSYDWIVPAVESEDCLVSIAASIGDPGIIYTQIEEPFAIHASPAGEAVEAGWRMRGHDERRSGKAEWAGPEYGCLKWQYQAAAPISAGMAAGAAGNLHVACEDGTLYTLDPNGEPVWQYETGSRLSGSPAVGPDGSVYFGAENGVIYALDKEGNPRWTHKTDRLVFSSPAVTADGKVYIASQDGTLYALGADGSERWTFTVPAIGAVAGSILASPTIGADGKVYIGGLYQAALYALNPANGSVAWVNNTLAGEGIFCSPVVGADGTIYLITVNSNLLQALNPANGAVVWTLNLADNASGWYENGSKWLSQKGYVEPVVGPGGTIYVSFADPYLRAVNPNGTIKWVSRVGMGMGFNLTVDSGGMIYAASEDGTVYVVEPVNGGTVSQMRGTLYNRAGLFTGMEAVDGEGGRYVGTAVGAISGYGPDESLKWQVQLNLSLYANGTITALGVVQDSPLYVLVEDQPGAASGYKYLVMLERQTGRTLYGPRIEWGEFLTYKTVQEYPVIAGDGLLYFTDYYNTVSAVSAEACGDGPLGLRRPGDVDSSGVVDLADYAVLAATWYMCFDYAGGSTDCYKTCTTCEYEYNGNAVIYQLGDINRDYYVNMGDLVELAAMWLEP